MFTFFNSGVLKIFVLVCIFSLYDITIVDTIMFSLNIVGSQYHPLFIKFYFNKVTALKVRSYLAPSI